MKKSLFILSAVATLVSCSPRETEMPLNSGPVCEISLTARFENPGTKTTLVDGKKVCWLPGDNIHVFTYSSDALFSCDIQEMAGECAFKGSISLSEYYYACYPAVPGATFEWGAIKTTLPQSQVAVDNNVDSRYLLSAGVSSRDGVILFRNVPSGICFTLESDDIKYVELVGNDRETIAGDIRINIYDDRLQTEVEPGGGASSVRLSAPGGGSFKPGVPYYVLCVPTVFNKGLSLVMHKDNDLSATFSIDSPIELKRSVFGRISLADKGLKFKTPGFPEGQLPPDNEIWYTTLDNVPLETAIDQEANKVVSHTYRDGMGVIRFSGPLTVTGPVSDYEDDLTRLTGLLYPDCVERFTRALFSRTDYIKEFRVPLALKDPGEWCFTNSMNSSLERFTGHHLSADGRCVILDGVLHGFAPAGLSSYVIPSGVRVIASGTFATFLNVKSVVIPSGVTELREFCFSRSGIESVTIPASVTSIHPYAFQYCRNLKNLLGDCSFISEDRKFLYDRNGYMPMTLFYFAGRDDESYEIPEGIYAVENYSFAYCDKLKSVTFPKSVAIVSAIAFEGCDNLEALYGNHTTSDHKGFINEWNSLQFLVPNISDDYVVPDDVKELGTSLLEGRESLRSVTMGDNVTAIGHYAFARCPNLKTVTLSANLASFGYNPFQQSRNLETVYFRGIVPPAYNDPQFEKIPNLKFYVPSKSYRLYTSSSGWKDYWDIMEPYDYTDLPEPDFYISEDYSREGEVTVYQAASEGNGIDLVFMGDAYSDREVASGKYLKDMKACAEAFFSVEPYKSFRKLFNIYFVTTVSATEGYARGGRSLDTYMGGGTTIGGNDAKCYELALKAVKDEKRMDEVLVVVCGNQDLSGSIYLCGTCYMSDPSDWAGHDYANGPAVTYFLKLDESLEKTADVLRHEAGGHGFAKLADEYNYSGSVQQRDIETINAYAPRRWYSNVDLTPDPAKIKWSAFLSDERYKYDGVGIFEGGYTYQYGIWRPSETSIMLDNTGRFNAPSRYTIWYRIHKLAYGDSWNGSYEDFVAYDAVNRITKASARTNMVERLPQRTSAPVVTGRTWREAR